MSDKEIEELAKFAAESLNGGNFYDKNYYNAKHREAWEKMIVKLLNKLNLLEESEY